MLRNVLLIVCTMISRVFVGNVFAKSCSDMSAEKKLAGAAKNSFLKKCEKDAKASCEADSDEKKLSGAARNSHMKKCVNDAVGAPA